MKIVKSIILLVVMMAVPSFASATFRVIGCDFSEYNAKVQADNKALQRCRNISYVRVSNWKVSYSSSGCGAGDEFCIPYQQFCAAASYTCR